MSARITISYEHAHELGRILQRLKPLIDRCKTQPAKGKYQRAYLTLKDAPEDEKQAN